VVLLSKLTLGSLGWVSWSELLGPFRHWQSCLVLLFKARAATIAEQLSHVSRWASAWKAASERQRFPCYGLSLGAMESQGHVLSLIYPATLAERCWLS